MALKPVHIKRVDDFVYEIYDEDGVFCKTTRESLQIVMAGKVGDSHVLGLK